jgi:aldehyde dehydrogenase (NAD+)
MAKYLSEHQDVESVWYFGSDIGSKFVEFASAESVKRTWVDYGKRREWLDDKQGQVILLQSSSTLIRKCWTVFKI